MNPTPRKKCIKWLSVPLGLALCLAPIASSAFPWSEPDLSYAVSAPSPVSTRSTAASDFLAASEQLMEQGLTAAQCNVLWARFGAELGSMLDAGSLSPDELSWLAIPNYRSDLTARYQSYEAAHPELSRDEVILTVNMNLDLPFYSEIEEIEDPGALDVLVNKSHILPQDFTPALELLGAGYGVGSLQPEAARQFRSMADAAWLDGITLYSVSAYRSFRTQTATYNRYLAQYSLQTVDEFSARAGHSEHQTGLALDINTAQTSAHFEETAEFAWLAEHCAEFGFLLRYPAGKEAITGYRFEPWHYRYVGVEVARFCTSRGLTYEEYVASQPADELDTLPTLLYQGKVLDLGQDGLILNDTPYVSAARLAEELGWGCGTLSEGSDLLLYGQDCRLQLYPGLRCQRDEAVVRLRSPALSLNGTLYLSLSDLCALMSLSAQTSPFGLELVHYQLL